MIILISISFSLVCVIILFMEPTVVIYGVTTEGYSLACMMSIKGANVYVVDESASLAINLKPEIAKTYNTISSLREDEPLLSMTPIDVAISNSTYVFFAPTIRKSGPDAKNEIRTKFKDAMASVVKNSSIICCLPTGFGDNDENISILEHVTGFEIGTSLSYFYYPLSNIHTPKFIGSFNNKNDQTLAYLLNVDRKNFVSIQSAEQSHAIYIMSKFSKLCGILEICKLIKDDKSKTDLSYLEYNDIYLDDMMYELYDLQSLKSTFDNMPVFMYLINGCMKSIANYIKRLIDRVKLVLKKNDLKSSRTKIILLWHLDGTEMRGDKLEILNDVISRLRDYVVDVEFYTKQNADLDHNDKTVIVISCSKHDYDNAAKKKDSSIIIIKANPLFEILR